MVRRICEITVTLNLSFGSFTVVVKCWKCWKTRLETPFKGDNVKAFLKTSNCENFVLCFSEKSTKIAVFAMLFWLSRTKQSFENSFGSPNDQKYPRYSPVLKSNVTLAQPLRFVILYFFKWKILSDDRRLYLHDSK